MNPIFYITAGLLLHSCGMVKDQRTATQQIRENSRTALQWLYTDSSGRYWHYQSDSTFYFHPEWGLYAEGGELLSFEQRRVHKSGDIQHDSSAYRTQREQYQHRVSRMPTKLWATLSVLLLLLALGYASCRLYLFRK